MATRLDRTTIIPSPLGTGLSEGIGNFLGTVAFFEDRRFQREQAKLEERKLNAELSREKINQLNTVITQLQPFATPGESLSSMPFLLEPVQNMLRELGVSEDAVNSAGSLIPLPIDPGQEKRERVSATLESLRTSTDPQDQEAYRKLLQAEAVKELIGESETIEELLQRSSDAEINTILNETFISSAFNVNEETGEVTAGPGFQALKDAAVARQGLDQPVRALDFEFSNDGGARFFIEFMKLQQAQVAGNQKQVKEQIDQLVDIMRGAGISMSPQSVTTLVSLFDGIVGAGTQEEFEKANLRAEQFIGDNVSLQRAWEVLIGATESDESRIMFLLRTSPGKGQALANMIELLPELSTDSELAIQLSQTLGDEIAQLLGARIAPKGIIGSRRPSIRFETTTEAAGVLQVPSDILDRLREFAIAEGEDPEEFIKEVQRMIQSGEAQVEDFITITPSEQQDEPRSPPTSSVPPITPQLRDIAERESARPPVQPQEPPISTSNAFVARLQREVAAAQTRIDTIQERLVRLRTEGNEAGVRTMEQLLNQFTAQRDKAQADLDQIERIRQSRGTP